MALYDEFDATGKAYGSDGVVAPIASSQNVDMRGVVDYGDLYQFASI